MYVNSVYSSLNVVSFADTMAYEDILCKRSRASHSKKSSWGEKKKTPVDQSKEKSATPEPEIPKQLEVVKKPEVPKLKAVIIGLPRHNKPPSPPSPVLVKGKGKMDEPSHPSKKQKLSTVREHRPLVSVLEPVQWREFNSQLKLKLHPNVGASGTAMVADLAQIMANLCNAIAPEAWERFKSDQSGHLLNLGLMSSLVVRILLLKLIFLCSFFKLFLTSFFLFLLSVFSMLPAP